MSEMHGEQYWESLVKKGLCRFQLLAQLAKGPLHGYAVNQAIKEACQGCCEPTEAMVYSTLRELQDHGYVKSRTEKHRGRRRRICWLTPAGEEAFQSAARVWKRMLPAVQDCVSQAHSSAPDKHMTAEQDFIEERVRERYGAHARRAVAKDDTGDCCEPAPAACCEPGDLEHAMRLYTEGEMEGVPTEALAASAGCDNPTALAGLRPGERVLDLGSGGGLDCFLAARQVGETGRVTGLDMTPEMLELARKNQAALGFTNVEFVQGQMESMPLPGDSFDVIISNCVVCLSPDKDAVFSESFRVLAPGGRIHLSDVLALTPERPSSASGVEDWVACAAGAEYREVYVDRLRRAGFEEIDITAEGIEFRGESEKDAYPGTASFKVTARKPA